MRKGAVEAGVGGSGKASSLPGPPARGPGSGPIEGRGPMEDRLKRAGRRNTLGPPEGGPSTSGCSLLSGAVRLSLRRGSPQEPNPPWS